MEIGSVRKTFSAAAFLASLSAPGWAADLSQFWPIGAQDQQWNLISHVSKQALHPHLMMTVESENTGPERFILWYSHKSNLAAGERNGETYRLCKAAGLNWLYFDAYLKERAGEVVAEHTVVTDKILFIPASGAPVDLIANGYYKACGGIGQPYLIWTDLPSSYRLQVWGHLENTPQLLWYWDVVVSAPKPVMDDCLTPAAQTLAITRQEAWWSNFKDHFGKWNLGGGETDSQGVPTGLGITYGRTVYDGAGQVPYLMIVPSAAPVRSAWCVDKITSVNGK